MRLCVQDAEFFWSYVKGHCSRFARFKVNALKASEGLVWLHNAAYLMANIELNDVVACARAPVTDSDGRLGRLARRDVPAIKIWLPITEGRVGQTLTPVTRLIRV